MMNARAIGENIPPVVFLVAVVGLVALALGLCDCAASQPGDLPAWCYDERLYTAKLLRCVDDAETLAQSQMCRQKVDYDCGVRQTVTVKR